MEGWSGSMGSLLGFAGVSFGLRRAIAFASRRTLAAAELLREKLSGRTMTYP
jgi:hypothetical protein